MKKKKRKSFLKICYGLFERAAEDHVGAYAAQAAYFMVLSFIPFIMFLTTMIRYTPLTYKMIREAIVAVIPQNLQGFVLSILAEVYGKSAAIVPIAAITAVWSAGKAMQSLTNGLNTIYHVKETRSWLSTRIRAVFFTVLFAVALIASLLLMVLGGKIQTIAMKYVPAVGRIIGDIMNARTVLVFLVLFLVFLWLFRYLPNRKASLKSQIPGALLTSILWSVFSYFFSLYFNTFSSFADMYGSLASLVMVLLWIDICMIFVLYGAETNAYFEKYFIKANNSVRLMMKKMMGDIIAYVKAEATHEIAMNSTVESEKNTELKSESETLKK
ncbi:MAG: YihY/virulence factor BrkB family protein [Eubacteriales bacterium]|nr:YihY/virulence factor BrkB family protein [Eubacteriales bacterium]